MQLTMIRIWRLDTIPIRVAGIAIVLLVAGGISCARRARDEAVAPDPRQARELLVADPVDHHDWAASEPMVIEHSDGSLFVSGYPGGTLDQRPNIWKSRDHGASWARVNVGTEANGAIGNSDVDLAVARDGTLYFVNLGYDNKTNEGAYVTMGVSRNAGETWSWSLLSKHRFDDRPWVKVAPDGTAYAIWSNREGVHCAVSQDRGSTWSERSLVHDLGGSSHLAVGPNGEVAVRVTPATDSDPKPHEGVDFVVVSLDGGKTWQKRPAPGEREWFAGPTDDPKAPLRRWVEPLAWDSAGALYSFWTNLKGLWLAQSLDRGTTWKIWPVLQGGDVSYFPYLTAGPARGELAGTWFSGRGDTLQAHLALFLFSDNDEPPRVIQSHTFRPDSWMPWYFAPNEPFSRDTAGEYLAVTFLRGGGLGVVSPLRNMRTKRAGFSWWRAELR